MRVIADANAARTVGKLGDGRSHVECAVCQPTDDVAGVFGVEDGRAAAKVEPTHIHQTWIPLVERNEGLMREAIIDGERHAADALAGCQLADRFAGEIDRKEMVVLVSAAVLQIEHVPAIALPREPRDWALRIARDHARIVRAERPHPNAHHPQTRSEIGDFGAVGRDLCALALRISEEHVARNERVIHAGPSDSGTTAR